MRPAANLHSVAVCVPTHCYAVCWFMPTASGLPRPLPPPSPCMKWLLVSFKQNCRSGRIFSVTRQWLNGDSVQPTRQATVRTHRESISPSVGLIAKLQALQALRVHEASSQLTLRSSVCAYTLLRRVLIHADCKWPSPTPSTTLPLYEMITCFI